MDRTKTFWIAGRGCTIIAALLVLGWLLAGCGAEPTAVVTQAPTDIPTEPPTATATPAEPPPTDTPAPTDTPLPTDTPVPTETPTPEVVDDSACIACHTSEETLKALAKEEEKPEVESEGEG
jgi:hypothetical protein